jgi:hypothetical protein
MLWLPLANSVQLPEKGAYVLLMLRSLMYADQADGDRDQPFIDMMHDFMESHHNSNASTESFKAIVEKHMPKRLDFRAERAAGLVFRSVGLWHPGTPLFQV